MAEQSNKAENNSLANIKAISGFETTRHSALNNGVADQKRRIEAAKALINEKRAKIEADELVKREKQQEKERLEQEREAELKANIDLPIEESEKSGAIVEPLIQHEEKADEKVVSDDVKVVPQEVKPVEQPVSTEETVTDSSDNKAEKVVDSEEPKKEAEVAVKVATVEPQNETKAVASAEKTAVKATAKPAQEKVAVAPTEDKSETTESEAERRRREQASAITNSIFGKPKKATTEKPTIRIYVPPVEPARGPRKPRDNANGGGFQPRNGGQGGGVNAQRNNAPHTQGGRPVLDPNIVIPVQQGGGKKKTDQRNTHVNNMPEDKSAQNKKVRSRYEGGALPTVEYDENGEIMRIRTRKTNGRKNTFSAAPQQIVIDHAVIDTDNITIKSLSEKIGKTGVEIIKQLFLLGIIKTINDTIDFDTADLVSGELGVKLELQRAETSEEKVIASHDDVEDDPKDLVSRPPIVTIMGHVDHGKTSILDYIRNANVAAGEAGGITQHIGAYSISVQGQQITFLDTPGHAAFTAMRARGADVTDIVIIVVAADDGIMPQTIEAINHAKAAGVQIIVAINKMDRPGADPDRIMTALTEYELVPEEWGGNVPVVKVSAKTGMGIQDLLETILINAEVLELKANPKRNAKGAIIEARLDKGKGPVATVLVQNGTLKIADYVVAGSVTGKIRAMQDDKGRAVKKAGPSMAVSVLGLQDVPFAGDQLLVVENEKLMKEVAALRSDRENEIRRSGTKVSLDDVFKNISDGKLKNLNLIIKADVQGSVEAIRDSMVKLSNDEVKVCVVHAVAGAINESDVMLADTTNSVIIGFNVRPDSNAKMLAEKNNIDIHLYRVIYDAIDDVTKAIKGLLAPKFREQYLGKAEIRVVYKITGVGSIAGCMVKDGKIVRNAKARVVRDNVVVCETGIASLKRMKDDAKEVLAGFECGIGLDNFNDIKEGDIIESFNVVQDEA